MSVNKKFTVKDDILFYGDELYCDFTEQNIISILNHYCESFIELKEIGDYQYGRIKELDEENMDLRKELFEARRDYLIETADISDKLHLEEDIRKLQKEILG